ncbi:MAG: exodeoxyribonuclease V subunit beta [Myxococcales bacterium]
MTPLDPANVELRDVTVIEASAGTGKTYTITSLVLRLLLERNLPIGQILVVTYTRAATAELKQRIRARLVTAQRVARGEQLDDPLVRDLCARVRVRAGQHVLEDLLERALSDVDEAPVLTIHGFCQRTLTEHAFESGAGMRLEVTTCAAPLLAEIADDYFTKNLYAAEANVARALLAEPEKLRILAARTGASDDLRLLPERIEVESFDREAWGSALARCVKYWSEDRRTILALVGDLNRAAQYAEAWASQWDQALKGASPGCTSVCSDAAKSSFTRSGARERTKKGRLPPEHPFFDAAEELVTLDARHEAQQAHTKVKFRRDFVEYLKRELEARSREQNVHTFDALLTELHGALTGARGTSLTEALRRRYRAALVDEFQDTDPVQYEIFRRIFGEPGSCLFLIGDPKQAIYGFRGADVHAYLSAREHAHGRVYTLDTNRRSDPALIQALNAFYANVHNPFALEQIEYQQVRAPAGLADAFRPRDGHAALDLLLLPGAPSIEALRNEICRSVAAEIARLLGSDSEIAASHQSPRRLRASDVAVLCRTNKQALAMQGALSELGIASVFQGDETVFRSDDAAELERVLEVLVHPSDATAVRTFLCSWYGGMDAHELAALEEDDEAWEGHRAVLQQQHEVFRQHGFMQALRGLVSHYKIEERLLLRQDGTRRITNLWHLVELLAAASISQRLGPLGLLRWFRIVRVDETKRAELVGEDHELRLESSDNAVRLTTVHKSKGLEYPIVFCPFLWAGDEPRGADSEFVRFHDPDAGHALSLDLGSDDIGAHRELSAQEALAEGLRLLYVALTRAKHRVCVTIPDHKGIAKSGLGYCLFGAAERTKGMSGDERAAALFALRSKLGGHVSVRHVVPETPKPLSTFEPRLRELKARAVRRTLDLSRRVSSFSGLTVSKGGAHAELGVDHDAADASPRSDELLPSTLLLDAFPRGAAPGQLIHEILEHTDFQGSPEELARTVSETLLLRGYPEALGAMLTSGLEQVMHTPLAPGLTLAQISRRSRLDEMEFVLPVTAALTPQTLERAFREQRAPKAMPSYAGDLKELGFDKLNGFLRGFIDMVFEYQGRFYVVDYKSNRLGPRASDYGQESMLHAMAQHHYFLQYHLYCLALHRHLALRVADYRYETHFGGVYYLFLRGMSPTHELGTGIFHDRPSPELIAGLERALGEHHSKPAEVSP